MGKERLPITSLLISRSRASENEPFQYQQSASAMRATTSSVWKKIDSIYKLNIYIYIYMVLKFSTNEPPWFSLGYQWHCHSSYWGVTSWTDQFWSGVVVWVLWDWSDRAWHFSLPCEGSRLRLQCCICPGYPALIEGSREQGLSLRSLECICWSLDPWIQQLGSRIYGP